jgi:competence protein CoiA
MNTKYAMVNNKRTEAEKGLTGVCPFCSSAMIAKCGNIRLKHWAHKSLSHCDTWFERETEWHRQWKNHFDASWQEFILENKTSGEKHIADVHTSHGLVVEFQHSYIDAEERIQREQFYENMIWVVDGTRLKRDFDRFFKGKQSLRRTNRRGMNVVSYPEECFSANWINSKVPVIFDFKGLDLIEHNNDLRNWLYCLIPKTIECPALLYEFTKETFIQTVKEGTFFVKEPQIESQQQEKTTTLNKQQAVDRSSNYFVQGGRFYKKRRF